MGEQKEQQERREKWEKEGKEANLNKVTMGMYKDVTTNFIFYT